MKRDTKLCGLVLAGGRSSRMGRDKAGLVHPDGRSLLRRSLELLSDAGCETVLVSLRHDQEIPAGLTAEMVVRDPEASTGGPMAGIVAAMKLFPESAWLVLACDLPRVDLATLSHLVTSQRVGEKFLAYQSESDGLPEPLCALYGSEALPIMEQALADDFRCPRKILIRNECRLLQPVTLRALENANTPADWENALIP